MRWVNCHHSLTQCMNAESRHMHLLPSPLRHTAHVSRKVSGDKERGNAGGKEADGKRNAAQQNKRPMTKLKESLPSYLPINN